MDLAAATTPELRAAERDRRIYLTAASSVLGKGLGVAITLATVPLCLGYLGPERYGLWVTIVSLPGLVSFADLGVGNGLLNCLSESLGRDDREGARRYVSSAFFTLALLGLVVAMAAMVLEPWLPWSSFFKAGTDLARSEAGPAVLAFLLIFAISMPLDVVQRVQMGFQEGFWVNFWALLGKALELAGLALGIHLGLGLPQLLALSLSGGVLSTLFNWVEQFGIHRPWLLPRPSLASFDAGRRVASLGGKFFLLQLTGVFSTASDNLVISHQLSPANVATYSVVQKMFIVGPLIQSFFLAPLWPAYGDAIARRDYAWLERTLRLATLMTLGLVGAVSLGLLIFGKDVLKLWVGQDLKPSFALLMGTALWTLASAFCGSLNVFMNAAGRFRFQLATAGLAALLAFGLKIWWAGHWSEAGVIWANALVYTFVCAIPTALYLPGLIRRMKEARP